jgi:hypothetical protein
MLKNFKIEKMELYKLIIIQHLMIILSINAFMPYLNALLYVLQTIVL